MLVAYERAQATAQRDWYELLPGEAAVTAVSIFELRIGVLLGAPGRQRELRAQFLADLRAAVPVLPFDASAAELMAELYVQLRRTGTPIGERDLQIAAIALAGGHEIITLNVSEFARVPGIMLRTAG